MEIFHPLQPSSGSKSRVSSADHPGFCLQACHSYHELPARYWKKYKYAAQFVQLVRSKTPKVTLYTEQAKAMLMENGPSPDFEACFYSGMWGEVNMVVW